MISAPLLLRGRGVLLSLLCPLLLCLTACSPPAPSLVYDKGVVIGVGWTGSEPPPGGWSEVLAVRAGEDPSSPALLGDYHRDGDRIIFTPRFPPAPGVTLHVNFRPTLDTPALTATFGEPAKAIVPTARVARVSPSAATWPANTLRMYVTFSAPMKVGQAYTHIRIRDDKGAIIEKPFVEIGEELWDPSFTRLTLLFDPGRIKRGLVDNETAGPPLVPGRTVTLEVDAGYLDATGAPMLEGFSRTIRVSRAERQALWPETWDVIPPPAPTAPLIIDAFRPLDDALARRAIRVVKDGADVAGSVSLADSESQWAFMPASPWTPGAYAIEVDGILEDISGNRPGKPFDVDLKTGDSDTARTLTTLKFTVAPGK